MSKKRKVYVCFEYEPDKALKELLIGQSRNQDSPFEILDGSLREAAPEKNWEKKAREGINRADTVLVMLGATTHRAGGVLKEIGIARELKKEIVQIIGHKGGKYHRIPGAGRLYCWTWDNLKKILGK